MGSRAQTRAAEQAVDQLVTPRRWGRPAELTPEAADALGQVLQPVHRLARTDESGTVRALRAVLTGTAGLARAVTVGRYRAHALPVWVALLVAGAGHLLLQAHVPWWTTIPGGLLAAAGLWYGPDAARDAWQAARGVRPGGPLNSDHTRAWASNSAIAAASWLALLLALGWSAPVRAAWLAALAVGAGPWWWHYAWGWRDPASVMAARWTTEVTARPDVPEHLAGSRLVVEDEDPDLLACAGVLELAAPATAAGAAGCSGWVESVLDLPAGTVTILPLGVDDSTRRASYVQKPSGPLRHSQEWKEPGLDVATGLRLAGHTDAGPLHLPCWGVSGGVSHRLWVGSTGAGKDVAAAAESLDLALSGVACVWEIDGARGASMPYIAAAMDWRGLTPEQWRWMVKAVQVLLQARQDRWAQTGRSSFVPTPEDPMVRVHVGEAGYIFRAVPGAAAVLHDASAQGRKHGISVSESAQDPAADSTGSREIRNNLAGGGVVWAGAAGDGQSSNIATGAERVNTTLLPGGGGWAVMVGKHAPGAPGRRRTMRGLYLQHAPEHQPDEPRVAQEWAARALFPALHPFDDARLAEELGEVWTGRRDGWPTNQPGQPAAGEVPAGRSPHRPPPGARRDDAPAVQVDQQRPTIQVTGTGSARDVVAQVLATASGPLTVAQIAAAAAHHRAGAPLTVRHTRDVLAGLAASLPARARSDGGKPEKWTRP